MPTSQSLIVKSPEAEARMFSAAGLNRTCPTFLFVHALVHFNPVKSRAEKKKLSKDLCLTSCDLRAC